MLKNSGRAEKVWHEVRFPHVVLVESNKIWRDRAFVEQVLEVSIPISRVEELIFECPVDEVRMRIEALDQEPNVSITRRSRCKGGVRSNIKLVSWSNLGRPLLHLFNLGRVNNHRRDLFLQDSNLYKNKVSMYHCIKTCINIEPLVWEWQWFEWHCPREDHPLALLSDQ